ncbi:MAG: chemotaxis protein CheD [Bacteriovoracaceae bacterium]|nr:chemotaxis protein CheD [Bacteriovoracaceae bacterium]
MAIVILDPKQRVVGMAHIALPESKTDVEKGKALPAYFVDTCIPYLLDLMREKGSVPHPGLKIRLIGGATLMDSSDHFQIGKRNVTAIRKILWANDLTIASEDVGERISRTVSVELATGKVMVTSSGRRDTV